MATLCRTYPGYTLETIADDLSGEQVCMLLEQYQEQPWIYAAMVEPKKR